jgi:hypothetical protein
MLWRSAAYIKDSEELDETRGKRDRDCMTALRAWCLTLTSALLIPYRGWTKS